MTRADRLIELQLQICACYRYGLDATFFINRQNVLLKEQN